MTDQRGDAPKKQSQSRSFFEKEDNRSKEGALTAHDTLQKLVSPVFASSVQSEEN
ncbi:Hypothetical predicted protein [Podarcis lilfordi]|uniref:Uncharacterized protein n=1 Tax=Podarcis lilfordi TaxID=74358 RepID=A0AA35PLM0_9SAUR|nr:Hypothetical predicted protein [Podarcis lilfordi]